jgi:hypothetical protein
MSTALIISLLAVAISLGVVFMVTSRSGPRVTTIETRRESEKAEDDA